MTISHRHSEALPEQDDASVNDEAARQQRIERNRPAIELLESWIAEGERATDEERRIAEEEWEAFKRGIDEFRLPGSKLFS